MPMIGMASTPLVLRGIVQRGAGGDAGGGTVVADVDRSSSTGHGALDRGGG